MASKSPQLLTKTPFSSDLIELKIKMNNSIPNSEETSDDKALEDVTPCSSAKKKALSRKKLLSSQEERDAIKDLVNSKEGILMNSSVPDDEDTNDDDALEDVTPCFFAKKKARSRKKLLSSQEQEGSQESIIVDSCEDPIDSEKTARYNSAVEEDDISDRRNKNKAHKNGDQKAGAKKRKAADYDDGLTPLKQFRTERDQEAKRKLALKHLVHKRNNQNKGLWNMTVDSEEDSPKESESSSLDDESSGDESNLSGFVVEDSQSQDSAEASYIYNPSKEELFEKYVHTILSEIVDEEFSSSLQDSNDNCSRRAQTYFENLINTKKDQVVSSRWRDYKKMLVECPVVKSESLRNKIEQKCEGCLMSRTLSECMVFYEEPNGRKIKEFKVGCYCAGRGLVFHDLHHFKPQLKERCSEKIHEVRDRAMTETPKEIAHKCIKDKEWVDLLYRILQSKLNAADTCNLGG